MRRFLACFILLVISSAAWAQPTLEQMRRNLAEGSYALAVQVTGPALIQERPNDPEAHFLYGYALYLTGNEAGARAELDVALSLSEQPLDPQFDRLSALLMASAGDTERALRLLENAFIRSQDYGIAMDWGRVAWQAGRFEEAIRAYETAANTPEGQRQLWPHLNKGRLFKLMGRYTDAIASLNRAIETFESFDVGEGTAPSPGYVEAFYRLGEVYEEMGDFARARSNYEAALIDPNYVPARTALERLARRSP